MQRKKASSGQHRQHAVSGKYTRCPRSRASASSALPLHRSDPRRRSRQISLPAARGVRNAPRRRSRAPSSPSIVTSSNCPQVLPAASRSPDAATVSGASSARGRFRNSNGRPWRGRFRFHAGRPVLPDQARDPPTGCALRRAAVSARRLRSAGNRAAKPGLRHQHRLRNTRVSGVSHGYASLDVQPATTSFVRLSSTSTMGPGACRESCPRCARQHGRHEPLPRICWDGRYIEATHRPASATRRRCAGACTVRSPGPAMARAAVLTRGSVPPLRASQLRKLLRRRRPPRRDERTR